MTKLIYGKGINDMTYGWGSKNELNRRIYIKWRDMIGRCYNKKYLEKRPTYKDCYVCERWLRLSNFVEDVSKIPNYEYWVNNPNKFICLDKDIKSGGTNKCYCLEECIFVDNEDNIRQANKTRDYSNMNGDNNYFHNHKYIGTEHTNATKVIQLDMNMNFIKEWDYIVQAEKSLNILGISAVCRGKRKSAGGFIWMYKDAYELYQQLNELAEIDK